MSTDATSNWIDSRFILHSEQRAVYGAARDLLLDYLDNSALEAQEIESVVTQMVERGDINEQDGQNLLREISERQ